MILNLRETLKASIYNPKHTKNTKIHFMCFPKTNIQKSIFSKNISSPHNSVLCSSLLHYLYCWGPHSPNSFVLMYLYISYILYAFRYRRDDGEVGCLPSASLVAALASCPQQASKHVAAGQQEDRARRAHKGTVSTHDATVGPEKEGRREGGSP